MLVCVPICGPSDFAGTSGNPLVSRYEPQLMSLFKCKCVCVSVCLCFNCVGVEPSHRHTPKKKHFTHNKDEEAYYRHTHTVLRGDSSVNEIINCRRNLP